MPLVFSIRPTMIGSPCRHRRTTLLHLPLLDPFSAAMPPTKVVQPHREPTHPPVIPWHFGEGPRLPDLPLIPQATGPVLPFNDAGMNLRIPQQGQPVFQPRFPREVPDFDPLNSTPCIVFFHLPRGQSLGPAPEGTTRPPFWRPGKGPDTDGQRLLRWRTPSPRRPRGRSPAEAPHGDALWPRAPRLWAARGSVGPRRGRPPACSLQ